MIIARTKKGKGVAAVEDQPGKHGKPLDDPEAAIEELGGERDLQRAARRRRRTASPHRFEAPGGELPTWELGEEVATRKAYGEALTALGAMRGDVVALDGEVSNSTHSEMFREAHPDRYFEMFIAEQQMVAAAVGMQVRGWVPFASTFAAFLSRAYDFVRMAAISRADIRLSGSHAGVSIGEDGPSQMALEDIASFRADPRLDRAAPLRRQPGGAARRGDGRPRRASRSSARCAARPRCARRRTRTCGSAAAAIVRDGRRRRDRRLRDHRRRGGRGGRDARRRRASRRACSTATRSSRSTPRPLRAAARECGALVTVEDHWPEGGLGDAVLEALAEADDRPPVRKLAVREMPTSGKPDELLHAGGHRRRRRSPRAPARRARRGPQRRRERRETSTAARRELMRAGSPLAALAARGARSDPRRLRARRNARRSWQPAPAADHDRGGEARPGARALERPARARLPFRLRLRCFCALRDPVKIRVRDGKPRGTPRPLRAVRHRRGAVRAHRARRSRTRPGLDVRSPAAAAAAEEFSADPAPMAIDDEYACACGGMRITRRGRRAQPP